MRLIYDNHDFVVENKTIFCNKEIIKEIKYNITAIEQEPCKRTILFFGNKLSLYIPLPFVQFYTIRCNVKMPIKDRYTGQSGIQAWRTAFVSVTKTPYQNKTVVENLPLPNHSDGKICFGDNLVNIKNAVACANIFWTTSFGLDFFYNFSDFIRKNKISDKIPNVSKTYINSCKSFSDCDPLKLEYAKNVYLNNILKEIK